MESGESAEQFKSRVRTALKAWHPDRVGHPTHRGGNEQEVIHVLSALVGLKEGGDAWPDGIFETGTRVIFPPTEGESENRTIFLPATPDEFLKILESLASGGPLPEPRDYPEVKLKVRSSSRNTDESRFEDEDPTLKKFQRFVMESDTFERLERALELFSLYSEEQLRSVHIPELMDTRAVFIFTKDAWSAKSKEDIDLLRTRVHEFAFFEPRSREDALRAVENRLTEQPILESAEETTPQDGEPTHDAARKQLETQARRDFVERVRNATDLEALARIAQEADNFRFFNRGELGVVKSVIARKQAKLGK